jgi:hypothetical protein
MSGLVRAAAAALAAAVFTSAPAQESILDRPPDREAWPTEITRRPLTLAPGMLEVTVPVDIQASRGLFGKPVSIAPALYYGATERLTVGLRHFRGLCLSGSGNGCPEAYDDFSVDAIWGATRDVALALALNASPLSPFALSAEGRVIVRLASGPVALTVTPSLQVGLTQRDTNLGALGPGRFKVLPMAFPLATTSYGFFLLTARNEEFLAIPASLTVQATTDIAVSVASAIHGVLDPPAGTDFSDTIISPLGAAVIVTPRRALDVGVSFTYLNLFGSRGSSDTRSLQVFATYRM